MSVGAIGAEILGGGGIHPPPWYTSLKHPMVLGVNYILFSIYLCIHDEPTHNFQSFPFEIILER